MVVFRQWVSRNDPGDGCKEEHVRGGSGPRQPGGGRQIAGSRDHERRRPPSDMRHKSTQNRPGRPPEGVPQRPRQAIPSRPEPSRPDRPEGVLASASTVQTVAVGADEAGMRVDRFLEARFPGLSFSHIQRIIRKGELRVNGKRAQPKDRLTAGQAVRIPPLKLDPPKPRDGGETDAKTREFLK